MRSVAKLTNRFADTCCYTNLRSNILTSARCGIDLNDSLEPTVTRKRGKHSCPTDRNDIRCCPKCKKLNDAIWKAHQNTASWVDDDALKWFETQQDTRRRKHVIYEEYMSRQDAPVLLYTQEGIQFIAPPVVTKKEKKNRLDAKKFKRISPEFLKLLQRHHDISLKKGKFEQELYTETETVDQKHQPQQRYQPRRTSAYLNSLKKLKTTPQMDTNNQLPMSHSKLVLMKTYFKNKKRTSPNQPSRIKGGKDVSRSSITYLNTYQTQHPPSPTSSRTSCDHISSNRQRDRRAINCKMSLKAQPHQSNSTTTSKALLPTKTLGTEVTQQEKPYNFDKSEWKKIKNIRTPSSSSINRPVTNRYRYRQKESGCLQTETCETIILSMEKVYDRRRDRNLKSMNKASTVPSTYKLGTVGDPKNMTRNFWQYRDERHTHTNTDNSKSKLKAFDSDESFPTSSCHFMETIDDDPFEAKSTKHSDYHGINTSLMPAAYTLCKLGPTTSSSVQTQTKFPSSERLLNEKRATSTQTLLRGSDSFPYLKILSPKHSALALVGNLRDNIIIKPNPLFSKGPSHRYPRI